MITYDFGDDVIIKGAHELPTNPGAQVYLYPDGMAGHRGGGESVGGMGSAGWAGGGLNFGTEEGEGARARPGARAAVRRPSCFVMAARRAPLREGAFRSAAWSAPPGGGAATRGAHAASGEADACAHRREARCQAHGRSAAPAAPATSAATRGGPVGAPRSGLVRLLVCLSLVARARALVPPPPAALARACADAALLGRGRAPLPAAPRWRGRRLAVDMCAPQPPPAGAGGSADSRSRAAPDAEADNARVADMRFSGEQTPDPEELRGVLTGEWLASILRQNRYLSQWMEDELHEMETSVGYDIPGQGQIVEYDPAFLSKAGWMVNLRGTVFSIPFIYWQFLGLLTFALAYAWAAGACVCQCHVRVASCCLCLCLCVCVSVFRVCLCLCLCLCVGVCVCICVTPNGPPIDHTGA